MKLTATLTLAAMAVITGSAVTFAGNDDWKYKDLYELKELHAAFHKAVSHAGIDATTKAQALAELLALWTDDGVIISKGVTYSGKGTPGTASCDPGTQTLCDFYNNYAGGLVLGHNWVSLTPIFTESLNLLDRDTADIYFQCIYFDVNNNDAAKSNATFGLPTMTHTAIAKKVHGRWLFAFAEVSTVALPTLDFYQE
jgi:hypothetical protein